MELFIFANLNILYYVSICSLKYLKLLKMKAVSPKNRTQNTFDEYNLNFPQLIDAIVKGEVILIVGNNFEFNTEGNKELLSSMGDDINYTDYIFEVINESYNTNATDFSELELHPLFSYKDSNTGHHKKANLYYEINRIVNESELSIKDVSESLRKLLSTGYFRFVMTTSFSPLVEIAMKNQWGENNVNVLNIYDSDFTKRDISPNNSIQNSPTLYYLLGKVGTTQKFAVTDTDYLQVVKTMIVDMANSNLLGLTSSKYLLALGCDQDDWLFRFIWYTLKTNKAFIKNGYIGRKKKDIKLDKFLAINNISLNYDSNKFAGDISDALIKLKENHAFADPRGEKWDVFISYSRKDGHIAQRVYDALTNVGLKVWYDKNNLGGRGGLFMDYIYEAIESSTIFMPILSTTITMQREENHPYRLEWIHAIEEGGVLQKGTISCVPIIEDCYDLRKHKLSDKIPEIFTKLDGKVFNRALPEFETWAESVKNVILNKQ